MNIVLSDSCLGIHTSDLLLHWLGLYALPTISYEENWEMHSKTLNSVNSEKKKIYVPFVKMRRMDVAR